MNYLNILNNNSTNDIYSKINTFKSNVMMIKSNKHGFANPLLNFNKTDDLNKVRDSLIDILEQAEDLIDELDVEIKKQEKQEKEQKQFQKVQNKIQIWTIRKTMPYKIIKSFLVISKQIGRDKIPLTELLNHCIENYDLTRKQFFENFNQMKNMTEKNHGKVFHVKNNEVEIWDKVANLIYSNHKYFPF